MAERQLVLHSASATSSSLALVRHRDPEVEEKEAQKRVEDVREPGGRAQRAWGAKPECAPLCACARMATRPRMAV
jgi:hypothetical protein